MVAPLRFASIAVIALSTALSTPAHAEDKKFGFDSEEGGGKGTEIKGAELARVNLVIGLIAAKTFTTKNGTYKGADIAADLKNMLKDGRLGKGSGAKLSTNASTKSDGKAGSEGDRVNIADHEIETGTKFELGRTLAHEWLHTHQTDATEAELEAPAYQLGQAVLLGLGGHTYDIAYRGDQENITKFKKAIAAQTTTLPGSNTPSDGSHSSKGKDRNCYVVIQGEGTIALSRDDASLGEFSPLPQHVFFTVRSLATPGPDRVMIFGADTTSPATPTGWLTVFDADSTHLFNRRDLALTGTRHPSSVDYDPATRRWYVLDTQWNGGGVTIWQDTNGDSVPDNRLATPFAGPASPGVSTAIGLRLATHPGFGPGVLLTTFDLRAVDDHGFGTQARFLFDINHDGTADQSVSASLDDFILFPPTIAAVPAVHAAQLDVCGEGGHTIQVWSTDSTGDLRNQLLGQVTPGAPGLAPVVLSRPLAPGEYVLPVDTGGGGQPAAAEPVVTPAPLGSVGSVAAIALILLGWSIASLRRRREIAAVALRA
jgi:hypothetical protein